MACWNGSSGIDNCTSDSALVDSSQAWLSGLSVITCSSSDILLLLLSLGGDDRVDTYEGDGATRKGTGEDLVEATGVGVVLSTTVVLESERNSIYSR